MSRSFFSINKIVPICFLIVSLFMFGGFLTAHAQVQTASQPSIQQLLEIISQLQAQVKALQEKQASTPISSQTTSKPTSGTGGISTPSKTSTTSTPSASSTTIKKTVPTAPRLISATGAYKSAIVTFSAPSSDGGSPILNYSVTCTPVSNLSKSAGASFIPGVISTNSISSPIMVNGLVLGTAYTCTVRAQNAIGYGLNSNTSRILTSTRAWSTTTPATSSSSRQLFSSSVSDTVVPCTDLNENMRQGTQSSGILALQNFLISKGLIEVDSATGYYGPLTVAGVKSYQQLVGLPQTGMVYEFTRGFIKKETCTN